MYIRVGFKMSIHNNMNSNINNHIRIHVYVTCYHCMVKYRYVLHYLWFQNYINSSGSSSRVQITKYVLETHIVGMSIVLATSSKTPESHIHIAVYLAIW
jgi:hypothetical protein